ncbi:MAG: 4Fe-4S binding protein [Endomicrobium sp.]|jgi:ferredoxin|nr:4Fe-4S binding protein [Endomicrobium sp.]
MAYKIDSNVCVCCGTCISSCPVSAIKQEGNSYIIDENLCSNCGICSASCPINAIS